MLALRPGQRVRVKLRCLRTSQEYTGRQRVRHAADFLVIHAENGDFAPLAAGELRLSNLSCAYFQPGCAYWLDLSPSCAEEEACD
jgi:hypothetical protein